MARNNDEQARKQGEKLLQIMDDDRKRQEALDHVQDVQGIRTCDQTVYENARATLVETKKDIIIVVKRARKHTAIVLVDVCVWTNSGPERVTKQLVETADLELFIDNCVAMAAQY